MNATPPTLHPDLTTLPAGSHVRVQLDHGADLHTRTASPPWQLGDGTWVVRLLDGPAGGYALQRVLHWGWYDLRLRRVWRGISARFEDRFVFVEADRGWSAARRIVDVTHAVYTVTRRIEPREMQRDFYNLTHASRLIGENGYDEPDQVRRLLVVGGNAAGPIHVRDPLVACQADASRLILDALASLARGN